MNPGHAILVGMAKRTLLMAQRNKCPLCGKGLHMVYQGPWASTVEHVWPRSCTVKGQTNLGNIVLTHQRCNNAKGSRKPRGCEVLFLFAVNRQLGYAERETSRWDQRYA